MLEEIGVALPKTGQEYISDVGVDAVDPGFDLLDRVNIRHESLIDDGQHRFPGFECGQKGANSIRAVEKSLIPSGFMAYQSCPPW